MSTLTEQVPPAELCKGDFVTLRDRDGAEVFATVARVIAPKASDRILVSYHILGGGVGTVDLSPYDRIVRVREGEAS